MERYGDREPHLPVVARQWFSRLPYVGQALQSETSPSDSDAYRRASRSDAAPNQGSESGENEPAFGTFLR